MSDETVKLVKGWLKAVAVPVVVAVIVGMGSGYLATQAALVRVEERTEQNSREIEQLKRHREQADASNSDIRERVARMETKIDILLMRSGVEGP